VDKGEYCNDDEGYFRDDKGWHSLYHGEIYMGVRGWSVHWEYNIE
tara:strand:- start:1 stop:135 length:135 start_codon:yes stop_codon:yes gene_type:complete